MRSVLFINRVYPPSAGATGQLLAQLAPRLVEAGWNVTVLCSRAGMKRTEAPEAHDFAGVRIERAGLTSAAQASLVRRALGLLLLYPALWWRALWLPRPDVIVVMTDPPLLVFLGALLRWWTGARLVNWVQDLYPEVAEEMGVLRKGGLVARALHALSNWSLRRCHRVIAIGECMRTRLAARGLRPERLDLVPNWSPLPALPPSAEAIQSFRDAHGWRERFVVMYSGNFGLAHEFEAILEAAALLQKTHPSMVFVMVGEGPRRVWVEAEVSQRALTNIQFLPRQSKAQLAESLSAADLHLASMRTELCGLVVPSKVYGILAAGRPCLFVGPRASEAARLIEILRAGSIVESPTGTGAALAKALAEWAGDTKRLADVAARCHEWRPTISVDAAARVFQDVLAQSTGVDTRLLAKPASEPLSSKNGLTPLPSDSFRDAPSSGEAG